MIRKHLLSFAETCRAVAQGTPEEHAALAAIRTERNRVAEVMPVELAKSYAACAQATGYLAVRNAQTARHDVYEHVTGEFTAVPPQTML